MKNLITLFFFVCTTTTMAQTLNNEWIDYSKTYYKFKVGSDGVCKIGTTALQAIGLGSTPAQNFQLWRNGVEVPIYTSVASGVLGASDYLEFYGILNDGKADKALYRYATDQFNDRVSLETDTSAYFLTVNPSSNNARLTQQNNNVAANTLAPEPYFLYTEKMDFKEKMNPGFANTNYVEYIYSSSYETGEMLTTNDIYPFSNYTQSRNFYPYTGSGNTCTVLFGMMGSAPNSRNASIVLNGHILSTTTLNNFEAKNLQVTGLPISNISTGSNLYQIKSTSSTNNDRMNVSFIDINYPRLFNFNNQATFKFELPAKSAGQYIEIQNFSIGASIPILYDVTNNLRYTAVVAGSILRFALPPTSSLTKYILFNSDASRTNSITALTKRIFVNYSLSANQGDYLIISNSILYAPISGSNPVEQYRAYRSTFAGGGFIAKTYDIDQLEDQFAFGIKKHPLSIKNFLRFARLHFTPAPKFTFLIGKGVNYQDYYFNQNQSASDQLNLIPTFGYPASDILLASDTYDPYPNTLIGRLAAVTGSEVVDYLNKAMQYETTQASTSQTQADRLWQKNVVHVLGSGGDANLHDYTLVPDFLRYTNIITDTFFGAKVTTLDKLDASTATNIGTDIVNQLFVKGFSLLNYFGHSSSTLLDFNLQDPTSYSNNGKYPMFIVSGCNAGDIFTYDVNRLTFKSTISDKYVLAQNLGSIGMIASTNFGLTSSIDTYLTGFYNSIDKKSYGKSIGQNMFDAAQYIMSFNTNPLLNFEIRTQTEANTLHGDPAIKINSFAKPDFSVEQPNILINPTFISVSATQFNVKVAFYNLGKAINDSIRIQVKRKYPISTLNPSGATDLVFDKKIVAPKYMDSINLSLPIISNRDKGTNTITVNLETDNRIDELSKLNNSASQDFVIYEDEITPVYPYNFSILNKSNFKFIASTSNPFSTSKLYRLEMDTTELFNSPLFASTQVTQIGGEVEFTPPISSLVDGKVYYWRVAPIIAGKPSIYQTASFLYSISGGTGWNQSHLYQHFKSNLSNIVLDSTSRNFSFSNLSYNLQVNHAIYGYGGYTQNDFTTFVNGKPLTYDDCFSPSIIFIVFDNIHFKTWINNASGLYGSISNCTAGTRENIFEFYYAGGPAQRKTIMNFMNLIPNGYYVVAKQVPYPYPNNTYDSNYTAAWRKDTLIYGSGQSVPDYFNKQGFLDIDREKAPVSGQDTPPYWTFIYKKNDQVNFIPVSKFGVNMYDNISSSVNCPVPDTTGTITSPIFGPAKAWQQIHWRGHALETQAPYPDSAILQVIGISPTGVETTLYNLNRTQPDFDISAINAATYPNIKLRLLATDTMHATPWQLDYWRINYVPVPEGALAPNLLLTSKDTFQLGEPINFAVAFKNVSDVKFSDSIKVNVVIVDKNNTQHIVPIAKKKDLIAGDTTTINIQVNSSDYIGLNNIYLDVNPASAQPEQYHFNNFLYKNFFVKSDSISPLLDVTFDGIHILNRDIVSSKPHIQIKLKDESKFLALNDTSEMKLTLRYPDGNTRSYKFGTDTLRFTPATLVNGDNTATIDFYPSLTQDSQDLDYELIVTAKDASGNKAGPTDYHINFQVFNKPMISNMFNYPNPFTTSTAFVFTITGSEIPQEFKIQILTITGKIVREVTKQELGPLNIGRNITEFKWNGTDQYGSKLANGVYIFRVVTSLNGKKMDKFIINDNNDQKASDATDQYFNKGYGKMYLMR